MERNVEETGKFPLPPRAGGACPAGKIRRSGYTATRRAKGVFGTLRGTKYTVKAACVKDRGKSGKGPAVIGPLKKGLLTDLGYTPTARAATRHTALDKAVAHYGRLSTLRKVNAVAVLNRRTAPTRSRIYTADVHYIQKKYF